MSKKCSSGNKNLDYNDNYNKKELNKLYNERVVSIQNVQRPMGLGSGIIQHQGNKIKTESGKELLIHRGKKYGKGRPHVITPASNMSSHWKPKGDEF